MKQYIVIHDHILMPQSNHIKCFVVLTSLNIKWLHSETITFCTRNAQMIYNICSQVTRILPKVKFYSQSHIFAWVKGHYGDACGTLSCVSWFVLNCEWMLHLKHVSLKEVHFGCTLKSEVKEFKLKLNSIWKKILKKEPFPKLADIERKLCSSSSDAKACREEQHRVFVSNLEILHEGIS